MLSSYLQTMAKSDYVSVRNDSTSIHYLHKGDGETTLLFLHGWCINAEYWEDQLDYFGDNYAVYALDLPGFGLSSTIRKSWTVPEYARDVIAFIKKLRLKNVVLIGHSMSGDIILQTALYNDPSIVGVIGIDNFKLVGVEFTPEQMEEYTSFIKMMEQDYQKMAASYADQYLFHPSTDSSDRARVKADFTNANEEVAMATLRENMNYGEHESEKLKELNYKLYLLNSDAYPTNIDGLKANCRKSFEIFDIHATGHYPMIEKPDEFNRILEQILMEI